MSEKSNIVDTEFTIQVCDKQVSGAKIGQAILKHYICVRKGNAKP